MTRSDLERHIVQQFSEWEGYSCYYDEIPRPGSIELLLQVLDGLRTPGDDIQWIRVSTEGPFEGLDWWSPACEAEALRLREKVHVAAETVGRFPPLTAMTAEVLEAIIEYRDMHWEDSRGTLKWRMRQTVSRMASLLWPGKGQHDPR